MKERTLPVQKYIKEFLISSAFIWVFYLPIAFNPVSPTKGIFFSVIFVASFYWPIAIFIAVILPFLYILFILRKEKKKLLKGFMYFCFSWLLFFGLVIITEPTAVWVQNQFYFGGQSEEHKRVLLRKAEKLLEEKFNTKFELVEARYENSGGFSRIAFYLNFQRENCEKDCQFDTVYLSNHEQKWRMKIINGEIWYLEE